MRSIVGIAALTLTTATVVAVGQPSDAATYSCRGETATVVGTAGDDTLRGTGGRDVIVALGGDDLVYAGGGDDLVCGGAGEDRVAGGDGADRLNGEGGADRLDGGTGDDAINGGGDTEWYDRGGSQARGDELIGGRGRDRIHPGPAQPDSVWVVVPDRVVYAAAPRGVTVDLSTGPSTGRATATGNGADTITWRRDLGVVGSRYGDRLTGSSSHDRLVGLGGDDHLDGGAGADELYPDHDEGGQPASPAGDDTVLGGDGADRIVSYDGSNTLHAGADGDVVLVERASHGDQVTGDGGSDHLSVYLTAAAGTLAGASYDGGAGDDNVHLSDEERDRRMAVDVAAGTAGPVGEAGARVAGWESWGFDGRGTIWRYTGTEQRDHVAVLSFGRLVADGRGGDDYFYGGPAADRVLAGDGNDRMYGSSGNDVLDGGAGEDGADGGTGTDDCRNAERTVSCEIA